MIQQTKRINEWKSNEKKRNQKLYTTSQHQNASSWLPGPHNFLSQGQQQDYLVFIQLFLIIIVVDIYSTQFSTFIQYCVGIFGMYEWMTCDSVYVSVWCIIVVCTCVCRCFPLSFCVCAGGCVRWVYTLYTVYIHYIGSRGQSDSPALRHSGCRRLILTSNATTQHPFRFVSNSALPFICSNERDVNFESSSFSSGLQLTGAVRNNSRHVTIIFLISPTHSLLKPKTNSTHT